MTDHDVPASLPLAADEDVVWSGRPRLSAAVPAALAGLAVAAAGVGWWALPAAPARLALPVAATALLLGVAIPALVVVSLVQTCYVATDRAAYVKRGVLGRSVSRARLARAEDTAYTQSITGSLFGYGTVELRTAGTSFAFRRVDDPATVRALVDEHAGVTPSEEDAIPGSLAEWEAVREEVRALRAAFEHRGAD